MQYLKGRGIYTEEQVLKCDCTRETAGDEVRQARAGLVAQSFTGHCEDCTFILSTPGSLQWSEAQLTKYLYLSAL